VGDDFGSAGRDPRGWRLPPAGPGFGLLDPDGGPNDEWAVLETRGGEWS
jgi:hypothetical protein